MKLHSFHGGLHLPEHKSESTGSPISTAAIPDRLILPLKQHIGAPAHLLVKPGDSVLKGQMLAAPAGRISAPIHAPTSGTVVDISEQQVPHPSGLSAPCIIIEPDGKEEWTALPPPMTNWKELDAETLIERVRDCGIVGLGGATFPSSVKLEHRGQNIDTLIINGAECEPFITCDDMLMREQAGRIIEGISILKHILDINRCFIGIENNKPEAIEAMRNAAEKAGLQNTTIVPIPTLYPSGGEKQLIEIITGKQVPSHGIPANIGIVCHNVGTAHAIAGAVLEGKPLISRVVTVTGAGVNSPCNLQALIGTPIKSLIEQAGGANGQSTRLVYGGPMMGFSLRSNELPLTKGGNCLLLPSEEESPIPPRMTACIRCGKCAEVCPARLLPQQLYWYARAKDFDKVQDYHIHDCIECGCCSHVCPSHIPLVQFYRFAKTELWKKEQEKRKADHARTRHEARVARLERLAAERKAKLRQKKEALEKPARGKGKAAGGDDAKKAAIEAAMKRVAAKKAAAKEQQPEKGADN
ncbi:MAG: electron transport complex subunit RsxC [Chromatiales bacterium]|jgi:electron transport complex protein RnfC